MSINKLHYLHSHYTKVQICTISLGNANLYPTILLLTANIVTNLDNFSIQLI
jgi:hypothetical protein